MGTSMTVRSVRSTRRERYTPVSWRREETEEKERSFDGRRLGGGMWQCRKERETRVVERERSATVEGSRSSSDEQLDRAKPMTCRKGDEESQSVKLCGNGRSQGSEAVGRFIDRRAASCFGSSVEEWRNGVKVSAGGFVLGVGAEAGDGEGGRERTLVQDTMRESSRTNFQRTKTCPILFFPDYFSSVVAVPLWWY